jgi:hypothetical protein
MKMMEKKWQEKMDMSKMKGMEKNGKEQYHKSTSLI